MNCLKVIEHDCIWRYLLAFTFCDTMCFRYPWDSWSYKGMPMSSNTGFFVKSYTKVSQINLKYCREVHWSICMWCLLLSYSSAESSLSFVGFFKLFNFEFQEITKRWVVRVWTVSTQHQITNLAKLLNS